MIRAAIAATLLTSTAVAMPRTETTIAFARFDREWLDGAP